jgi:pilus assembly protein Flp/PilA
MMTKVLQFLCCEDGPTSVEYAVMLALIIITCIAAITLAGGQVFNMWGNNRDEIGSDFGS